MSAESRACHEEAAAERIVADGMKRLRLGVEELGRTPGSDLRKVAIALAVHRKTAVPQRWTAERLGMKSAVNVCPQIKRLKQGQRNVSREIKQWISRIDS